MALKAVHLHEQYLEDFLNLKALRESVLRGRGRVGASRPPPWPWCPGVAVLNRGVVPVPVLKRKCLKERKRTRKVTNIKSHFKRYTFILVFCIEQL